MQLYAGQQAGTPEVQVVKVNTRGTGFRHDEARQLYALAVAATSADGILDLCHRHSTDESIYAFERKWVSLCIDCKE